MPFEVKVVATAIYAAANAWMWLDSFNSPDTFHVLFGVGILLLQVCANSLFIRKVLVPYFKDKIKGGTNVVPD